MNPPPPPVNSTFTAQEILAVTPNPPQPTGSPGPTHTSSRNNLEYDPIPTDSSSLVPIRDTVVGRFREYTASMSPSVSFTSELNEPFNGISMTTEGDVTIYVDRKINMAAWEVVLRMVPQADRTYDPMIMYQKPIGGGVPDMTIGAFTKADIVGRAHQFTACGIIELKAPGIVKGLLSIFENIRRNRKVEPTTDWVRVTRQLRKYAATTSVRDIVVMDASDAIYFRLPTNPAAVFEPVEYAIATTGASYTDTTYLTQREIVALMCWRSMDSNGFKFRNFGDGVTVAGDYASVLNHDRPPNSRKRDSGGQNPTRRVRPKRGAAPSSTDAVAKFGWVLNALVELELNPPTTTNRDRPSRDSGFYELSTAACGSRKYRPSNPPLTATTTRMSFRVTQILKQKVAVLTPTCLSASPHPVIAKIPFSDVNLGHELAAYAALLPLQGGPIPHFYGACRIVAATTHNVLLIEHIMPGVSVEALRNASEWERVASLRESAGHAMAMVHEMGVLHRDACARNFVACGDGRGDHEVVIVDFDAARVFPNPSDLQTKVWEDDIFLAEAFTVPATEDDDDDDDDEESDDEGDDEGDEEESEDEQQEEEGTR